LEGVEGTATVMESTFRGNVAENSGGGLFAKDIVGLFTTEKVRFEGNVAKGDNEGGPHEEGRGGFYITVSPDGLGGTDVLLTETEFLGNSAEYYGGGFYAYNLTTAEMTISKCIFQGNSAEDTGGILVERQRNGHIMVFDTLFTNNEGMEYGGALQVYDELTAANENPNVTVSKCTFELNKASDGLGGAVYIEEAAHV